MPLRIALDTRRVADFGIGTYIRNLVRALAKVDDRNQYQLITNEETVPEFSNLPSNFKTTIFARANKKGTVQSGLAQIRYGLFLRKLEADLFHIPLNAVPLLMPKPYLVTIHDMSTLLFASQLGYRNRLRHFYLRRGLIRADRVMAVSMATCRDVEAVLGIPMSRMRVVYNAPDPIFHAPMARHGGCERAKNLAIHPKYSACWIAIASIIHSFSTWDEPTRRRTSRAWWRPLRCCGAKSRTIRCTATCGC